MADRSACLYQLSKERDTVTLTQPPKDADRMIDVDERFEQRPQLRMYRAIAPGEKFFRSLFKDASHALAVSVLPPSLPACAAEVAHVCARAWPADGPASWIKPDQRLDDAALSAGTRVVSYCLVAHPAYWPDRPFRVNWPQALALAALTENARAAALADRIAGFRPSARPEATADPASSRYALVAATAQVRTLRTGATGNRATPSAASAYPRWRLVAEVADGAVISMRFDWPCPAAGSADLAWPVVAVLAQRRSVGKPLNWPFLMAASAARLKDIWITLITRVAD